MPPPDEAYWREEVEVSHQRVPTVMDAMAQLTGRSGGIHVTAKSRAQGLTYL